MPDGRLCGATGGRADGGEDVASTARWRMLSFLILACLELGSLLLLVGRRRCSLLLLALASSARRSEQPTERAGRQARRSSSTAPPY